MSLFAIVGGETLLGRELREVLGEIRPEPRVQLISAAAEGSAILGADEDEPVVMLPLNSASLEGSIVTFLAASAASSRRTLKLDPRSAIIDLTAALEERPDARLRAPSVEIGGAKPPVRVQVIAHPAAIVIASFLTKAAQVSPIRSAIIHIFEPASERGKAGLDELQKQTVAVLAFKKLPTEIFDAQLAFSMLARYGEEATEPLEGVEERIERHLASLLAAWPGVPMPSLRLIQAPVFHGHSFSVWIELDENPGVKKFAAHLEKFGLDVRPDDPPANAAIAGQSGVSAGAITRDPNNRRALWVWLVADNLRIAAENAAAVAREML